MQNAFLCSAIQIISANKVTVKNALWISSLFNVEKLLTNELSGFVTTRRLYTKVSIATKKLFEKFYSSALYLYPKAVNNF